MTELDIQLIERELAITLPDSYKHALVPFRIPAMVGFLFSSELEYLRISGDENSSTANLRLFDAGYGKRDQTFTKALAEQPFIIPHVGSMTELLVGETVSAPRFNHSYHLRAKSCQKGEFVVYYRQIVKGLEISGELQI